MPVVPDDGVEDLADLVAPAFQKLDVEVIGHAQYAGDTLPRIVPPRLFEDAVEQGTVHGIDGPAGIEAAHEHGGQVLFLMRERNSARKVWSLRKEPRMTELIIIVSVSFTPRQCMQK